MWCTVFNCSNNNNNPNNKGSFSFFTFPRNKILGKQWNLFCKRKDKFSVKTAKICCKHFVKEDFANYLQYEMGKYTIILPYTILFTIFLRISR